MSKYFNPTTDPRLFACPHCGKGGPAPELLLLLDAIRGLYGKPIRVTSGPRCQDYNDSLPNSVPDSAHISGKAADLACSNGSDRLALIEAIVECGCKRIGVAKTFIHVDVDGDKVENLWLY